MSLGWDCPLCPGAGGPVGLRTPWPWSVAVWQAMGRDQIRRCPAELGDGSARPREAWGCAGVDVHPVTPCRPWALCPQSLRDWALPAGHMLASRGAQHLVTGRQSSGVGPSPG